MTAGSCKAQRQEPTMSMPATVWIRSLYLRRTPAPKLPRLNLGLRIADAAQRYADAVSIPYVITFGLEPHKSTRDQRRSKRQLWMASSVLARSAASGNRSPPARERAIMSADTPPDR